MSKIDHENHPTPNEPSQSYEDTPLLRTNTTQNGTEGRKTQESILKNTMPLSKLVLCFMTIHFLLAFCELILIAPLIKLLEQSLCISYYDLHDPSVFGPGGDVPELLCKIPEIQTPLATIRGWKSMLDTFPGREILFGL